jgi:hypothetical protein
LDDKLAKAVLDLSTHPAFGEVWKHFDGIRVKMEVEILSPLARPDERDTLVKVRERFVREVVSLPEKAASHLNKKTAGQAQAPA